MEKLQNSGLFQAHLFLVSWGSCGINSSLICNGRLLVWLPWVWLLGVLVWSLFFRLCWAQIGICESVVSDLYFVGLVEPWGQIWMMVTSASFQYHWSTHIWTCLNLLWMNLDYHKAVQRLMLLLHLLLTFFMWVQWELNLRYESSFDLGHLWNTITVISYHRYVWTCSERIHSDRKSVKHTRPTIKLKHLY